MKASSQYAFLSKQKHIIYINAITLLVLISEIRGRKFSSTTRETYNVF